MNENLLMSLIIKEKQLKNELKKIQTNIEKINSDQTKYKNKYFVELLNCNTKRYIKILDIKIVDYSKYPKLKCIIVESDNNGDYCVKQNMSFYDINNLQEITKEQFIEKYTQIINNINI